MTLSDLLAAIDRIQARRYDRLDPTAQAIAATGIKRHLSACKNVGVGPDVSAIREIIDDAQVGRAVYAEKADVVPAARPPATIKSSLLTSRPWVKSLLGKESFTAAEAARLSNLPANNAICRLRQSPLLRLQVLGHVPGEPSRTRLYKLEKVKEGASEQRVLDVR